ncbi:nuclear transport factor 2 family protein [Shimia sagamensis]|uniref:SnoaL-like domain-containing protein n=1 Tax=Shimia sagamensis TaxID=1566352 RepID=A0ABY1P0E2_9RHOB|nr:nuclear transport factor 2 family protein [Shimia sagamensis]SMP23335.1 SnoaL-like domain-containing protein [Shimia sagamensis]
MEDVSFVVAELSIDLQRRDAIVAWTKANAASFPPGLAHVWSNFVIGGDGQTAELSCISRSIQNLEGEIKPYVVGRYFETLVKTPEGWRLKDHRLQLKA